MIWQVLSLVSLAKFWVLRNREEKKEEKRKDEVESYVEKKKQIRRRVMRTTEYLSWGRGDQSPSSSCCRSYTGCHSGSWVAPALPAQNTCSCRSPRSAHTETQSVLRTKHAEVQQVFTTTKSQENRNSELWKWFYTRELGSAWSNGATSVTSSLIYAKPKWWGIRTQRRRDKEVPSYKKDRHAFSTQQHRRFVQSAQRRAHSVPESVVSTNSHKT